MKESQNPQPVAKNATRGGPPRRVDPLRVSAVGAGVEFESGQLNAVADFLDGRGNDRRGVEGMAEFQVHAAADVLKLQHGAAPGGSGDGDLYGLGTEFGMAREQRF